MGNMFSRYPLVLATVLAVLAPLATSAIALAEASRAEDTIREIRGSITLDLRAEDDLYLLMDTVDPLTGKIDGQIDRVLRLQTDPERSFYGSTFGDLLALTDHLAEARLLLGNNAVEISSKSTGFHFSGALELPRDSLSANAVKPVRGDAVFPLVGISQLSDFEEAGEAPNYCGATTSCSAGGDGATSCSIGCGEGGGSCSATCGTGWYACCRCNGTSACCGCRRSFGVE